MFFGPAFLRSGDGWLAGKNAAAVDIAGAVSPVYLAGAVAGITRATVTEARFSYLPVGAGATAVDFHVEAALAAIGLSGSSG
jgi:hypothetical protein